jgi:hypothetical protein
MIYKIKIWKNLEFLCNAIMEKVTTIGPWKYTMFIEPNKNTTMGCLQGFICKLFKENTI